MRGRIPLRIILLGAAALLVAGGCPAPKMEAPAPLAPAVLTLPAGGLPATSGWQAAGPGLQYRVQEVSGGLAQLTALLVDSRQLKLAVLDARQEGTPAETVRQFAERHHALAAINGGFFDENHAPLGLLMHRSQRTNPLRRVDWGVFLVADGQPEIRHTREALPKGTTEALQCGPRLLIGGRVPRFKPGESLRAAVGITGEGLVMLATTSRGELSLQDFARALKAWGCVDALNLDGGPSAQLYVKSGSVELDLPGAYAVPDALVVLPAS